MLDFVVRTKCCNINDLPDVNKITDLTKLTPRCFVLTEFLCISRLLFIEGERSAGLAGWDTEEKQRMEVTDVNIIFQKY